MQRGTGPHRMLRWSRREGLALGSLAPNTGPPPSLQGHQKAPHPSPGQAFLQSDVLLGTSHWRGQEDIAV